MEASDNTFADKLINSLRNAATELEELQVQMALGKAEAKDLLEDLKKKFNSKLNDLKSDFIRFGNNKNILSIVKVFENLQFQLALCTVETKEMFEEQIKKIRKELSSLELELEKSGALQAHAAEIKLEIEKFTAKLELIALQFKLKKVITEYNFQEKKIAFHHKMDELRMKVQEKESLATDKGKFFKNEIEEAYSHLKKAFAQHLQS